MREDIHRHAAVDPGTLRYAQNVRWGDQGAAIRRYGTTEIATTSPSAALPVASGRALQFLGASRGQTVCGTDGLAFALDESGSQWRYAGTYSTAEPRGQTAVLGMQPLDSALYYGGPCVAVDSSGYTLVAAGTGATVFLRYADPAGRQLWISTISTASRCRAVSVGATIYLCVQNSSTQAVDIYSIAANATSLGAATTSAFVTLSAATGTWDIHAWTSTHWVFAWLDDAGTDTIRVHRMSGGTSAANFTYTTNVNNSTNDSRLTVYADTDHVWCGHTNATTSNAYVTCRNWTGAAFSGGFTSTSIASWGAGFAAAPSGGCVVGKGPSATQVRVLVTLIDSTYGMAQFQGYTATTAASFATGELQQGFVPLTKTFGPSGQYVWGMAGASISLGVGPNSRIPPPRYVLLRTRETYTRFVTQLVTEPLGEFFSYYVQDAVNTVAVLPSGNYVVPTRMVDTSGLPDGVTTNITSFHYLREFAINDTLAGLDVARGADMIVGGQPGALPVTSARRTSTQVYGDQLGFHRPPAILSLTASNGAGSLTPSSTYSYVAVYRYIDGTGRILYSEPSPPRPVTMGASDDTVAVVVANVSLDPFISRSGAERVVTEIHRTEAGGTTYHLVREENNDSADLTDSFSDLLSDSDISDNRILYTQSSHVANSIAPASRFRRFSENRLWLAGGWDPTIVQASQIMVPEEPPLFSDMDTFKVVLPEACTGLAFQDGALLAFGATDIYAIGTDGGPGNDGLGTFADPRLISPGIGCEEPASIVETPVGVFFRSRRGFELMPRGLGTPQPLPGVETTLETYSVVASACLHVDETAMTVQVVMRNPSNAATRTLVYDLDRSAWSVDVYPVDVAQIGITADGRLLMASDDTSTSPAFLVESSSAKDDDAVFFQSRLTFHDLYPFGVFKEGQVNSVLARAGADGTCVLNVDIGVNGATARNVTWTIGAATTFETYREQTPAATQPRGTSIQLDVYDTTSGDAAGGASYFGFGLHVSDKDSVVGLAAAERA